MPERSTIPTPQNPDKVTFTVKVDGEAIPKKYQVLSIFVERKANRIPFARLTLRDGDVAKEDFPASNQDVFAPGKEVEFWVGYHNQESLVFKGILIKQRLRIRKRSSRLIIECRDAAFKMTVGRKNRYFEEVTDSDAMDTIIGEYGLDKEVAATSVTHPELVQYNATDWDFILSRSDANGQLVFAEDGKVVVRQPDWQAEESLNVLFGATILELDAEMDGRTQYEASKGISWDHSNQELLEVDGTEPGYEGPGNLSPGDLSSSLDQPVWELRHSGRLSSEELQAWADAKLMHSRLSKVRGRVKFQGFAELLPGQFLDLGGLGERFSGKAFVSGVLHEIAAGNWTTYAQFGFEAEWYAEQYEISSPPAAHLLPSVSGLQIGKVTALENDPEGEDRIKVRLPIIDAAQEGTWARLACLEAGDGRGAYFRPEIGDEVIVGFINDDPREAVVLGALHSSARPTPEPISDDNHIKGYTTRSGMLLTFDDDQKIIHLETPAGNKLSLDESMGGITLEDENRNKIVLDSQGITIESAGKLILKASNDATMEGMSVSLSGQTSLKAEGSASAEISSGGTTTVKGSLVQIN